MSKVHFGGNTTDPEVKKLMEKFSVIKPGDLLSHAEIAALAGAEPKSNRYYTVVEQFRKKLEQDLDLILKTEFGKGYRVLSADQRVDLGVGTVGRGLRFVKRGGKTIANVVINRSSELSEQKKRTADNAGRLIQNLVQAGRKMMREIKNPTMQERLPLRTPPASE